MDLGSRHQFEPKYDFVILYSEVTSIYRDSLFLTQQSPDMSTDMSTDISIPESVSRLK